jgi:Fe-S-cluster containining protein
MPADAPVTVQVELTIGGQPVQGKLTVPQGPIRPRQLLPIMQEMTNLVVSVAETREAKEGRKISCAAGCGACCRQLVPIAPSEARQIAALIDALPEPRRSQIRERFTAAAERLTQAGIIEELRHPERITQQERIPFALSYFRLGIPCPFLEAESCSIHPDRPLSCREYLVTSAPVHCAEQAPDKVQGVRLDAKVSRVLRGMEAQEGGATASWVPLILAPEWAAQHPDKTPPRPGLELLRDFLERLTGQKLPDPTQEGGHANDDVPNLRNPPA